MFYSVLGLGMSSICIQKHTFFYSTFTNVFFHREKAGGNATTHAQHRIICFCIIHACQVASDPISTERSTQTQRFAGKQSLLEYQQTIEDFPFLWSVRALDGSQKLRLLLAVVYNENINSVFDNVLPSIAFDTAYYTYVSTYNSSVLSAS